MSRTPHYVAPQVELDVTEDHFSWTKYAVTLNYVARSLQDGKVEVLSYQGERTSVFEEHTQKIWRIMHLFGDIVVSLDVDENMISWDAATGEVLAKFQSESQIWSFSVYNMDTILVGTEPDGVQFIGHENGRNFKQLRHFKGMESCYIRGYNDTLISCVSTDNVIITSCDSGRFMKSLVCEGSTGLHVGEHFIIFYSKTGKCTIYENALGYSPIGTLEMGEIAKHDCCCVKICDVRQIDSDLIMVTVQKGGIYFICMRTFECVGRLRTVRNIDLVGASILSDGRIIVHGDCGYCAFFAAPSTVKTFIAKYTDKMKLKGVSNVEYPQENASNESSLDSSTSEVSKLKAELTSQNEKSKNLEKDLLLLKGFMKKIEAETKESIKKLQHENKKLELELKEASIATKKLEMKFELQMMALKEHVREEIQSKAEPKDNAEDPALKKRKKYR